MDGLKKIKVLVVDDQQMSRQLFEMYVKNSEKYELVYSLGNAMSADLYCQQRPVDLVLMDVLMKEGIDGLEAAARIKKNCPDIKIIIVTSMPEVSYIRRAREIGVDSFWYKETSREPILEIMDRTMAGEHIYPDQTPTLQLGYALSTDFTDRELDILREMTTGASNAEIADTLHLSPNTVRNYIQQLMSKTGYKSRTELAVNARVKGLVISREAGKS